MGKCYRSFKNYNYLLVLSKASFEGVEVQAAGASLVLCSQDREEVSKAKAIVSFLKLHDDIDVDSFHFDIGADSVKLGYSGVHFYLN